MPVKPLLFKGDKKPKKRKNRDHDHDADVAAPSADADVPAAAEDDDTWTTPDTPSDLSGPVIFVLPTQPVTCLAADAHGNVFASQLENIVEGYADTAEPHDVRQVWVANQVVGTGGQMTFKASHGGFLSCDGVGTLGARREARGVEEGFVVEDVPVPLSDENDGRTTRRWRVRTTASTASKKEDHGEKGGSRYLCAVVADPVKQEEEGQQQQKKVALSLRGDGDAGAETVQLVIKMQARFKPRLQQNKETKAMEKISRKALEQVVGRRLEDDEVKRLKRARKNGMYHEEILDVRVKGKHDKFA